MTDDLITWLRGVLDEDERAARDALAQAKVLQASTWNAGSYDDPASVLADIAAKRAILDLHKPIVVGGLPPAFCSECQTPWTCRTVRLLASAYADRPGDTTATGGETT